MVNGVPNPQVLIQKTTAVLSAARPSTTGSTVGNIDWIPVVTAGINYCATELSKNSDKIKNSLKGDRVDGKSICSATGAFFLGCMFTFEFKNCPATKWNKNDSKCNDLKNYFIQCPSPQIN